MACVDENGNLIKCQPAGNQFSFSDGSALHCAQHEEIQNIIISNVCGTTTTPTTTTTTSTTTTTTTTTVPCGGCSEWYTCHGDNK